MTRGQCPTCKRPTDPAMRPFCSRRCADIDLGRWFGEAYRVPATRPADIAEAMQKSGPTRLDPDNDVG